MTEVLVVLECNWKKGMPFLSFGLKEAFATRMLAKCSVRHEKEKPKEQEFTQAVDSFVVRSMDYAYCHPVAEWHMHVQTGAMPFDTGRNRPVLNFGIIAAFHRKQMVALQIEPYGPIPPELDEWFENAHLYVKRLDPSTKFSKELRADAFSMIDISVHGFEIGMELFGFRRPDKEDFEVAVSH